MSGAKRRCADRENAASRRECGRASTRPPVRGARLRILERHRLSCFRGRGAAVDHYVVRVWHAPGDDMRLNRARAALPGVALSYGVAADDCHSRGGDAEHGHANDRVNAARFARNETRSHLEDLLWLPRRGAYGMARRARGVSQRALLQAALPPLQLHRREPG